MCDSAIYMYLICSKYRPEQLVFIDESSCDRRISRKYGCAIRGQRATKKTIFVCGKRFYCMQLLWFQSTLTLSQILSPPSNLSWRNTHRENHWRVIWLRFICEVYWWPPLSYEFIPRPKLRHRHGQLMNPQVRCGPWDHWGTVRLFPLLIIDISFDCTRGMWCEFLPPYSPDYNPIELALSKFKACIKGKGAEFLALDQDEELDVHLFLIWAIYSVTAEDAHGYFRHCGYI